MQDFSIRIRAYNKDWKDMCVMISFSQPDFMVSKVE